MTKDEEIKVGIIIVQDGDVFELTLPDTETSFFFFFFYQNTLMQRKRRIEGGLVLVSSRMPVKEL